MNQSTTATLKVFALDDIEWWVGESLEACLAAARAEAGDDCYREPSDQHEVSPAAMHKLKFIDDEDNCTRTFAEQLEREIARGGSFPRIFAATDF